MDANTGITALQLNSFFLPSRGAEFSRAKELTNWLDEPEIPSSEEFLASSPGHLLDVQDEDITSKEQYLEKQYRMQRYESVEQTRLAVSQFRQTPLMPEGDLAHIYTEVQVLGVVLTGRGAAVRVSLSTDRAPDTVDWINSDRLRSGSLVVLSPVEDAFRTECRVATVAYRFLAGGLLPDLEADPPEPDDTPARVDLFFSTWPEDLLDSNTKYYMVEAKNGYFESFRHTMMALQAAASEKSVIDKYLLTNNVREMLAEKTSVKQREQALLTLRTQTRATLDKSQATASVAMMNEELSIIQGPPGTGKTHTTAVTIEEIIRCHNPRTLIIAAKTNHATDRLLRLCLRNGLLVSRFGGRTVSDDIKEHSLFNHRERIKGTVPGARLPAAARRDFETALQVLELHLRKASHGQQNYDAKSFRDAKIITIQQFDSLQNEDWETLTEMDPLLAWLGWESFKSPKNTLSENWKRNRKVKNKAENVDEDCDRRRPDPEKPIGPYIRLERRPEAPASRFKTMLARNRDLYKVKAQHREELFNYMCYELSKKFQLRLPEAIEKFQAACHRLQSYKAVRDSRVITLSRSQVVGCTITGLSKYRDLLQRISPDILIIDEASEATEGSIVAALLPSLKHLALVGDHQQLTPRCVNTRLTLPNFALDISLFERLVTKNNMPYQVLNLQRRMIPEIRQLVNVFYPGLCDHSSVLKREKVKGIGQPLWWFDHAWPEQKKSGASGQSILNKEEAEMITSFAEYLIRCGTPIEKLTILTFYTAQQELIEDKLGPNICKTVDSFQGCENDVILLSIVRSPPPGQGPSAGFIENIHRATVALSRARNALYIFGNASNLQHSSTWGPVLDALGPSRQNRLPLKCPIHSTTAFIRSLQQWSSFSEEGCRGESCENDGVREGDMPNGGLQSPVVKTPAVKAPAVKVATVEAARAKAPATQKKRKARGSQPKISIPLSQLQHSAHPAAVVRLDKATLDRLEDMSSHGPTPNIGASTVGSQNSAALQSSDYMIKVGYDAVIAELEELTTEIRGKAQVNVGESIGDLIDFN
ncbi:DEAD box helicase [Cordyceps militaris]|uniref:DEAD box helicase n=1 Tax=Cordyceps militaris TaxID=73501 RepID=A0A2H4SVN1_CORMI|nr:DEAD box helicase [Cordyceps militaris]